ncbi:MAG TPA: hypothetical protein VJJ46_02865 [Anaerolineales bacterium]|nr:hypothetical protein [Anaerolineales bacterium]
MTTRRILVWTLSLLIGFAAAFGAIAVFGTTLERFSLTNAALVVLSIASLVFIWLDHFLKTQYLRH